ncbi:MAG: hypothetical protein HY040_06720 [Planctomycetes bacterium]|nr:hypothetical protein [Planctomycetota bacterium]
MSLVHEPLIHALNRRFVCCYFNSHQGPGYDAEAVAFVAKAAAQAKSESKYGLIVTPEGDLVAAFGYRHSEVLAAVRSALRMHPLAQELADAEAKIVAAALRQPRSAEAQFAAARLYAELLDHESAVNYLEGVLQGPFAADLKAQARYLKGRMLAQAGDPKLHEAARKLLSDTASLPKTLVVEAAMDRIALDIEPVPDGSFFTGYRFKKGVDPKKVAGELEAWIEKAPLSRRLGEMRFYLGLAQYACGDKKAAEATWQKHTVDLPEDRFALLSRLHHSSYAFAPQKGVVSDPRSNPDAMKILQKALKRGVNPDGSAKLTPEEQRQLIELLGKPKAEPKAKSADKSPDAKTEEAPIKENPANCTVVDDDPFQILRLVQDGWACHLRK